MSTPEKTQSPEADLQTMIDLYQQAADYLETSIAEGNVDITPSTDDGMLTVATDVPVLNGKRIHLEYERPSKEEDVTQLDLDAPLTHTDEVGHWHTPIGATVYGLDGVIVHDYTLEYSGEGTWARVSDQNLPPGQVVDGYAGITVLDAKELIAHLEWALGGPDSGDPEV